MTIIKTYDLTMWKNIATQCKTQLSFFFHLEGCVRERNRYQTNINNGSKPMNKDIKTQ